MPILIFRGPGNDDDDDDVETVQEEIAIPHSPCSPLRTTFRPRFMHSPPSVVLPGEGKEHEKRPLAMLWDRQADPLETPAKAINTLKDPEEIAHGDQVLLLLALGSHAPENVLGQQTADVVQRIPKPRLRLVVFGRRVDRTRSPIKRLAGPFLDRIREDEDLVLRPEVLATRSDALLGWDKLCSRLGWRG